METAKSKSLVHRAQTAEQVLESYYSQFLKWGSLLTRGDEAMAREIVHDLCLHFALARPDFSHVENLDGYLYTCLRHIYLSTLDRASRDAAHLVNMAEYDSMYFALRSGSPDGVLQRQNDLRRICSYATWRKESTKSASYLILLFFHGYTRSQIAAIARIPLAAVYNKLKIARGELKDHLASSNRLTIARGDVPPDPGLRVTSVTFAELFEELRARLLNAKTTECLTEDGVLEHYRSYAPKPISCELLAHIVSCERCLTLLDRHFGRPTLGDREPPVDSGHSADGKHPGSGGYHALMRSLRWRRDRIYEHRPGSLSIAVNGKITASHDVQGERSTLSSRIENPQNAQFVEVFSEQQIRLALLSVGERPPDGLHWQTQRIALSDDRWLQLTLSFDGLGLQSEVTYVDPTLTGAAWDEDVEDVRLPSASGETIPAVPSSAIGSSWRSRVGMFVQAIIRQRAMAWAVAIFIMVAIGGFSAYRWLESTSNPNELLSKSMRLEAVDLTGQTEHQVLRVEETSADGQVLFDGTVDAWKDGTGRRMRRLYDGGKHVVAAEWQLGEGRGGSYSAPESENLPEQERAFAESTLWRRDVSATAFEAIAGLQLTMQRVNRNYEITSAPRKDELQLTSATLVLNGQLHAVGEILGVQIGTRRNTLRLMQTDYERRPVASAPAGAFDPPALEPRSGREHEFPSPNGSFGALNPASTIRLVQLHIAVLNQLNQLGADVGEPLEVKRTPEGRIRISGTVEDAARKRQIVGGLAALTDHELVDVGILSPQDIRVPKGSGRMQTFESASVYNLEGYPAPADALIRKHFSQMEMSSDRVNTLSAQFSRDALDHAQRALQQAYALDRLGIEFSANELAEIDAAARHQWAGMAASHASAFVRELHALHLQLDQLAPEGAEDLPAGEVAAQLQDPTQFGRAVHRLLRQTQLLNEQIGLAFASGSGNGAKMDAAGLISAAARSMPLYEADNLNAVTERLGGDGTNRAFASKQPPKRTSPQ